MRKPHTRLTISKLGGRKPRIGSMVVEDYLQPAAVRAGVLEVKDGKRYIDGEFVSGSDFTPSGTRSHHGSWQMGRIPRSSGLCCGGHT